MGKWGKKKKKMRQRKLLPSPSLLSLLFLSLSSVHFFSRGGQFSFLSFLRLCSFSPSHRSRRFNCLSRPFSVIYLKCWSRDWTRHPCVLPIQYNDVIYIYCNVITCTIVRSNDSIAANARLAEANTIARPPNRVIQWPMPGY